MNYDPIYVAEADLTPKGTPDSARAIARGYPEWIIFGRAYDDIDGWFRNSDCSPYNPEIETREQRRDFFAEIHRHLGNLLKKIEEDLAAS